MLHPDIFPDRPPTLRLAVTQFASRTGDLAHNAAEIVGRARRAASQGCRILLCPELSLTGYTVNPRVTAAQAVSMEHPVWDELLEVSRRITLVVGFAEAAREGHVYNSAAFLCAGQIWHVHRKLYLPSYGVFNEGERFDAGRSVSSFDTPMGRMGMLICADAWHPSLAYLLAHEGTDLLLILTASPEGGLDPDFDTMAAWERLNQTNALTLSMYVACANVAGREGGLRFTGGSHVAGPDGSLLGQAPRAESHLFSVDLDWERLERQREVLPFRRVDELEITLQLGSQVLNRKHGERANREGVSDPSLTNPSAS